MSVEEQFYVLWPLLALVTAIMLRLAGRLNQARPARAGVIAVLSIASLGHSIHLTSVDP